MNTKQIETTTNSHLFNKKKSILAKAVATVIAGVSVTSPLAIDNDSNSYATVLTATPTTIDSANATSGYNATTNFIVMGFSSLNFNGTSGSGQGHYYGNITSSLDAASNVNGLGNFTVSGNTTLHGNVGIQANSATGNATGNWTVYDGNTLTLSENVTVFNAQNMTLDINTTLNLGDNSTTGVNRDSDHQLNYFGNISMATNSTINLGSGTTVNGIIQGTTDGLNKGTLNILGNFTHDREIGTILLAGGDSSPAGLEQINISQGNIFTMSRNVTATRMNINGTVTATGNITAAVTMGSGSVLNLNTETTSTTNTQSANVTGVIQSGGGVDNAQGTLNINGTWATGGQIGQGGLGLAAINISSSNNVTDYTGFVTSFAHNVNATTITIGTSSASSNATLRTSADPSLGAGSELIITGNIEGSGSSNSSHSAKGILDINTNTSVTGTIGASNSLDEIQIATGTTLTINSSVTSDNITLEGAGGTATLQVNGTSTITAAIDGSAGSAGNIIVGNEATATFVGKIGAFQSLDYITVNDNATMIVSNDIDVDGQIRVHGTLSVTSALSLNATGTGGNEYGIVVGNATQGSIGSILKVTDTVTISNSASNQAKAIQFNNATLTVDGTHTSHASDTTAYIDLSSSDGENGTMNMQGNFTVEIGTTTGTLTDGANIYIAGNGTLNISSDSNVTVTSSSASNIMDLTINNNTIGYGINSNSSLIVTTNYKSTASLGLTGNTAAVWDASATAVTADLEVFNALGGLSGTALKNAIATMHPATGGAEAASVSISGSSMSTAGTRMAYTRQTGLGKGMNAGGATLDESMWVQIFGANVDQDNVSGISGYDADGQGLAMGIDGMSEDGMTRIGIAGSFANTDVTGKDSTTKTTTDIDTTQVMVYANKDYADGMYVEGVASYAFNDNTGTRRILVGAVDRTASSAYDSGVFAVNVEAGWPKENNGVTITPTLGLAYSHLSSDAYTETGAGNMNLKVTPGDVSTFESKVGVKITGKSVDADGGIGRPEVRIGVTHNFGDDTADSTATFTAGGTSFKTTGVETDSTKVDLGLGYTYTTPEGDTDISVNIDGRHSSSYLQYGGGLTVKWKF